MRDCYVGDIGSYDKYGLLRAIGKGRRVGVACICASHPLWSTRAAVATLPLLKDPTSGAIMIDPFFDTLQNLMDEKR